MTSAVQESCFVGKGIVFDRVAKRNVEIGISAIPKDNYTTYVAFLLERKMTAILGRVQVKRPATALKPGRFKIMGPPHIYMSRIDSFQNKRYKDVGTILDQIPIEVRLLEGLNDNTLNAEANHAFHYKKGYRFYDEEYNVRLKEEIDKAENGRPDTSKWPMLRMHLIPETLKAWVSKIREKPVLFATKEKNAQAAGSVT